MGAGAKCTMSHVWRELLLSAIQFGYPPQKSVRSRESTSCSHYSSEYNFFLQFTYTEFCLCVGAGTPSCMVFPNSLYSVPNSYFQINLAPTAFLKLQTIHSNHLQKYVNPEGTRTLNLLIRSQTR